MLLMRPRLRRYGLCASGTNDALVFADPSNGQSSDLVAQDKQGREGLNRDSKTAHQVATLSKCTPCRGGGYFVPKTLILNDRRCPATQESAGFDPGGINVITCKSLNGR